MIRSSDGVAAASSQRRGPSPPRTAAPARDPTWEPKCSAACLSARSPGVAASALTPNCRRSILRVMRQNLPCLRRATGASLLLCSSFLLSFIGCGSAHPARQQSGRLLGSSPSAAGATSAPVEASPEPTDLPPEPVPSTSPRVPEYSLDFLRSKALGEVSRDAVTKNAAHIAMLRAVCRRVVHDGKHLGCEEYVDCPEGSTIENSTLLEWAIPGSFTRASAQEALVITKRKEQDGYMRRYFLLEKREGRFWMINTFEYFSRPLEVRVMKTEEGRRLVAMRMMTPGTTPGSAVVVWRMSDAGPEYIGLVDLQPCIPCNPSDIELDDFSVRDVDRDKNDDIIVRINDYTRALESERWVQRLANACDREEHLSPPSQKHTFNFLFRGDRFDMSAVASSMLQFDGTSAKWATLE